MKRLPDSELELMMIIWDAGRPVTRTEIEERMPRDRQLSATTILSFLSRLEEKDFVRIRKEGRSNVYEPLIEKEAYLREESRSIWKRLYQNSVGNIVADLGQREELAERVLDGRQQFMNQKRCKRE